MLFWMKLFGMRIQSQGCCTPCHYGNVGAAKVRVLGGIFVLHLFYFLHVPLCHAKYVCSFLTCWFFVALPKLVHVYQGLLLLYMLSKRINFGNKEFLAPLHICANFASHLHYFPIMTQQALNPWQPHRSRDPWIPPMPIGLILPLTSLKIVYSQY